MDLAKEVKGIVVTLIYSGIGMGVFMTLFFLVIKFAPFSVVKEIEEDQNTSLAILIGSMILGISIIIAAAISGSPVSPG